MFRVGQKVVCVDAESNGKYVPCGFGTPLNNNMHGLKLGSIYTIRELDDVFGVAICRLEEIRRDYEPILGNESGFALERFRPIVERKTDISIFTAMLKPSRVDA